MSSTRDEIDQVVKALRETDPDAAAMLDKMIAEMSEDPRGAEFLAKPLENSPAHKAFEAAREEAVITLFEKCDPGVMLEATRNGATPDQAKRLYAAIIGAALHAAWDMGANYVQVDMLKGLYARDAANDGN